MVKLMASLALAATLCESDFKLCSSPVLTNLNAGLGSAIAQNEAVLYKDQASGISFNTWSVDGLTFGMALPSNALTTDATEFVGLLVSSPGRRHPWNNKCEQN